MDRTIKDIEQISKTSIKGAKYAIYWGFVPLIIGLAVYDYLNNGRRLPDVNSMWAWYVLF